jgi:transcriptional regulator with XRE-family HTH domain
MDANNNTKLERARIAGGFTYRQISDETHIPRSTVERIHKGQSARPPSKTHARAIYEFYGGKVPIESIYDPHF